MNLHRLTVRLSRYLSALAPRQTWMDGLTCQAVRERCKASYSVFKHCENPYPKGCIQQPVWQDQAERIARSELSRVVRKPEILLAEMVRELTGMEPNPTAYQWRERAQFNGEFEYA